MQASGITDVAHSIQLAVAPVFLVSGVAATPGRIIDRARSLEEQLHHATGPAADSAHAEVRVLSRRARLVQRAITLLVSCALCICLVIVTLFAGVALGRDLSRLIVVLFVVGLFAFIGALVAFLIEIRIATASLRFGPASK